MLCITGKLAGKSLIHEGVSQYGTWRIVRFFIEKTFNKKKCKIIFTAKGKLADKVFSILLNEKLDIYFFPDCKEVNSKWYTELRAVSVEKYVPANKQHIAIINDSEMLIPNSKLENELQLFDIIKK